MAERRFAELGNLWSLRKLRRVGKRAASRGKRGFEAMPRQHGSRFEFFQTP